MDGELVVGRDGTLSHIHSDKLTAFTSKLGELESNRVSNVETWHSLSPAARRWLEDNHPGVLLCVRAAGQPYQFSELWWADLRPVNGPVLGPFVTRAEALDREVVWLRKHHLHCEPCRAAAS